MSLPPIRESAAHFLQTSAAMPGTTPITFEISLLVSTAGGCERASSAPFGRAVAQKLKANSGLQRCQLGSSEYYSIGFLQDQISNRRGSPPLGEEAFAGCLQVARSPRGKARCRIGTSLRRLPDRVPKRLTVATTPQRSWGDRDSQDIATRTQQGTGEFLGLQSPEDQKFHRSVSTGKRCRLFWLGASAPRQRSKGWLRVGSSFLNPQADRTRRAAKPNRAVRYGDPGHFAVIFLLTGGRCFKKIAISESWSSLNG